MGGDANAGARPARQLIRSISSALAVAPGYILWPARAHFASATSCESEFTIPPPGCTHRDAEATHIHNRHEISSGRILARLHVCLWVNSLENRYSTDVRGEDRGRMAQHYRATRMPRRLRHIAHKSSRCFSRVSSVSHLLRPFRPYSRARSGRLRSFSMQSARS